MNPNLNRRYWSRLGFVLGAGYFLVGWWPFDFRPANQVRWLPDRPGLLFENRGLAYDPNPLPEVGVNSAAKSAAQFTIELWVTADCEPGDRVSSLLTVHHPRSVADLMLCQWQQEIMLRRPSERPLALGRFQEVGARGALQAGAARFITVCSSDGGTDFYRDGQLAEQFPGFRVLPELLDGQLILGADAAGKHTWAGRCFGVAVYERALTPSEVATNHALWMHGRAAALTNVPGLRALYRFEAGSGSHPADTSGQGHRLFIPSYFEPLHREWLIAPWNDLASRRLNYSDIIVNGLGFVPFGFCFFLSRQWGSRREKLRHSLRVIFAAAVVSCVIEIIQAWLPGRISSLTDLLTNTLGAAFGVLLVLCFHHKLHVAES